MVWCRGVGRPFFRLRVNDLLPLSAFAPVAEVAWTIPPTPGARYRITVELSAPTGTLSTNEYRLAVQGPAPITPWRGWLPASNSSAHSADAIRFIT